MWRAIARPECKFILRGHHTDRNRVMGKVLKKRVLVWAILQKNMINIFQELPLANVNEECLGDSSAHVPLEIVP